MKKKDWKKLVRLQRCRIEKQNDQIARLCKQLGELRYRVAGAGGDFRPQDNPFMPSYTATLDDILAPQPNNPYNEIGP